MLAVESPRYTRKELAKYGTIFCLQPQAGREQEVVALLKEWQQTYGPAVPRARAVYVLRSERRPGGLVGATVLDDEATYRAHAPDPIAS